MKRLSVYVAEAMKKLGSGAEGTVYDIGNGKVKKVFKHKVPIAYQLLKAATDMDAIQCLPKVYEVGKDYVIRENCTPNTSKCKKYWNVANQVPFPASSPRSIWQHVLDGTWWVDYTTGKRMTNVKLVMPKTTEEVIDWLLQLEYEISQICGPMAGLGDFAEKNLGETQDGRVVLMDF